MRTISTILVAFVTATSTGVALAEPPPAPPDFHEAARSRDVAREHATSDGDRRLQPVDVVFFGFDSVALDAGARDELRAAATWLQRHPEARLVVEGHADASGPDRYNARLAERRALTVRDALIEAGAPARRLEVASFGESWPASSRAENNRRVRIWGELPERTARR